MSSLREAPVKPAGAPYKIWVAAAHVLLSLLLTYPLVFKLTTHVIGPAEDNLNSLWNLWWVKHALLNLNTNPYYTDYLFYPEGASLAFHSLSLFNSLLSIPLQFVFSRITCYNLLILLSFVLAGWGMYLLVYQLTRNVGAAFIASLVFAYSPYHFAHAEHHLQLSSIQFIPFFILYLIRLFEQPGFKHALLAGLFLCLSSLCSWYYLICPAIFCFVFICYKLLSQPKRYLDGRFMGWFLAMLLFFGILISPFLYPILKEKYLGTGFYEKTSQLSYSADAAAFFIPPPVHPLAPQALRDLYDRLGGNPWEATVFLGYLAMLLSGYAIYKLKWDKTGVWVVSGLIFGVLALGPRLHVMGKIIFPDIPMPYWLIQQIPLLNINSAPSRFIVMVFVCLSVLVGYAIAQLTSSEKQSGFKLNTSGLWLMGGLILFEYMALPVNTCSPDRVTQAHFIQQQLAEHRGNYAILELPLSDKWFNHLYMYRQTFHQKKLLSGSVSRLSHSAVRFLLNTPLKELVYDARLDEDFFIELEPLLIANRIKFVVFNHYLYRRPERAKLYSLLNKAFKKGAEWEDKITIFVVY